MSSDWAAAMNSLLLLLITSILLTRCTVEPWFSLALTNFNGCYVIPGELGQYAKSVYIKGKTLRVYKRPNCKGPKIPDAVVRKVLKKHGYISSESRSI